MDILITSPDVAALQAECNDYNTANATSLTVEEFVQQVLQARAAANRARYGTITPYAFVERFSPKEYAAIRAAAADERVAALLKRLGEVQEVHLFSEEVAKGLTLLEGAGLIGPGRAAEIMSI